MLGRACSVLGRAQVRSFSSLGGPLQKFVPPKVSLPPLPYEYGSLEPVLSGQIMELHHTKHHQAYVNNFNAAQDNYADALEKNDVTKMIALQGALRFNGGGHVNHSIFWTNLAPTKQGGGEPPQGDLEFVIKQQFGSFDNFKQKFSQQAVAIQGSGWAWLAYNKESGRLEIISKPNQDPLTEAVPLLGFDVWEHAYYMSYGPNRMQYLTNLWKVVNWRNVQDRFEKAKSL